MRCTIVTLFVVLTTAGAHAAELPAVPGSLVREIEFDGVALRFDLGPQVLDLRAYKRNDDEPLLANPLGALGADDAVPAALLAQKAKQFDDGLYAAVELAAEEGAGALPGKRHLLATLAAALAGDAPEGAPVTLEAAARLGGETPSLPKRMEQAVAARLDAFNRSGAGKPLGFYTWSPALGAIFRQDRMLQSELVGSGNPHLVMTLHADPALRTSYERYLELVAGLTNPWPADKPDLRATLARVDAGSSDIPREKVYFFPPSRAHETDLVKRLYGNRHIPDDFSLIDELARQIRAGTIDLTPKADSGWYDWSTWALETLAAPERAAEARKLELNDEYRQNLHALFQGVVALTRETHIKQLEAGPATGMAAPMQTPKQLLLVAPRLRAEPLATYYLRRAQAYGFVAKVLTKAFGDDALVRMHRQGPDGAMAATLADELAQMQAIFLGAYAAVDDDLGMPPDTAAGAVKDEPAFLEWRARIAKDADLERDARMMVPLFFDRERRKTKVVAFLGWAARDTMVAFATPPTLIDGPAGAAADVRFISKHETFVYPVSVEIYVRDVLDREQFRAVCDANKTPAQIVQALQR